MSYRIALGSKYTRDKAKRVIDSAPDGYVAVVEEPKRTLDQNAKLWSMLSDIAMAKPLGRRHTPEEWKSIFMAACGWDVMFLEGLDGRPFPAGFKSSQLTKSQMSILLGFIEAWASEQGIDLELQEQAA